MFGNNKFQLLIFCPGYFKSHKIEPILARDLVILKELGWEYVCAKYSLGTFGTYHYKKVTNKIFNKLLLGPILLQGIKECWPHNSTIPQRYTCICQTKNLKYLRALLQTLVLVLFSLISKTNSSVSSIVAGTCWVSNGAPQCIRNLLGIEPSLHFWCRLQTLKSAF